MDNNKKKIDRKLYNKVSPGPESTNDTVNQNPVTDQVQHIQPLNLENPTTENPGFLVRTYNNNLYHVVQQIPMSQKPEFDVFCDYELIKRTSKISRLLIIIKILFSIYYFYISLISLLILLPETVGYIGTRFLRNRMTLFYSFWLFIELIIRVIVIILLGLQMQVIPISQIIIFGISIPVVPINVVQILVILKLYNQIAHLEGNSKKTVLHSLSKSYCPP